MSFGGHVNRKDHLEKAVLTERVNGKRARGRQGLTYFQSLKVNLWKTSKISDFIRIAERWDSCRLMAAYDAFTGYMKRRHLPPA